MLCYYFFFACMLYVLKRSPRERVAAGAETKTRTRSSGGFSFRRDAAKPSGPVRASARPDFGAKWGAPTSCACAVELRARAACPSSLDLTLWICLWKRKRKKGRENVFGGERSVAIGGSLVSQHQRCLTKMRGRHSILHLTSLSIGSFVAARLRFIFFFFSCVFVVLIFRAGFSGGGSLF